MSYPESRTMLRRNKLAVLSVSLDRLQEDRRSRYRICCFNNPRGESQQRDQLERPQDVERVDSHRGCEQ